MNTSKKIFLLSIMVSFFGYIHASEQIASFINFLSDTASTTWPLIKNVLDSEEVRTLAKMSGQFVPPSEADLQKLDSPLKAATYFATEMLPYLSPPSQSKDEIMIQYHKEKEKREFIEAKVMYEECLKKNPKDQRRLSSGIPCNCKTFANKFAMAGGEAELEQLTKQFNDMYKIKK